MKYFKLYKQFFRINLIKSLAFRGNFILGMFLVTVESLATYVSVKIVFHHIHSIAGWNYNDMLVLSGVFMTTHALAWLFFKASLQQLDILINRGDLDWLLVKPVDAQFIASSHDIDIEDAARGVVGVVIMYLGLRGTSPIIVATHLPALITTLLCGQMVIYSLCLVLKTISFKSIQGWATNAIFWRFHDLARYPTDIYRGIMRTVYTFVFPLAFVATVPARALLGRLSAGYFAGSLLAGLGTFMVCRIIWKWALKSYSSASS